MHVVDLDRRAVAGLAVILAGIPADAWDAPTPCPEWTVGDLVAHVVAGNVKYTDIAKGGDWARGAPEVQIGDDPPGTYRATADVMLRAWDEPGVLDREITLPVGRGRPEAALYIHLGETLVHGWDLARATGQEPQFETEVVEASLAQYRTWLPLQRPPGTPFADAGPVADDAAPIDRLAAYLGRDVGGWGRLRRPNQG